MPALADDDVVVDSNFDLTQRGDHSASHLNVGLGWGRVAARVVVDHDDGAGRELQCPLHHFARLLKAINDLFQRVLKEQIKDRPMIGSEPALLDYLQLAMQHEAAEHFRILFLDRKNILIRDEVQSRGTTCVNRRSSSRVWRSSGDASAAISPMHSAKRAGSAASTAPRLPKALNISLAMGLVSRR
jgi:RadC-like JAB domain